MPLLGTCIQGHCRCRTWLWIWAVVKRGTFGNSARRDSGIGSTCSRCERGRSPTYQRHCFVDVMVFAGRYTGRVWWRSMRSTILAKWTLAQCRKASRIYKMFVYWSVWLCLCIILGVRLITWWQSMWTKSTPCTWRFARNTTCSRSQKFELLEASWHASHAWSSKAQNNLHYFLKTFLIHFFLRSCWWSFWEHCNTKLFGWSFWEQPSVRRIQK